MDIGTRERTAVGRELPDDFCQHLVGMALAAKVLAQNLKARTNLGRVTSRPSSTTEEGIAKTRESIVFPYGRFTTPSLRAVNAAYRHYFRIGGADNDDWDARILYRVTTDNMRSPKDLFSNQHLAKYRVRHYWNRLRGRQEERKAEYSVNGRPSPSSYVGKERHFSWRGKRCKIFCSVRKPAAIP